MNRKETKGGIVMTRNSNSARLIGLALAATLAGTALGGCATMAPKGHVSASRAEKALAKGNAEKAIGYAEQAVLAEPRNANYRAVLGNAYLNAGRFDSAATSFDDAMALGDTGAGTSLSLALAYIGAGKKRDAAAVLDDWRDDIEPGDLGLAYALAGQPDRGVHVLAEALRNGENTPKVRQNLAYAFALAGDWKQARIMVSKDVAPDQVGQRMLEWAHMMKPGADQERVAGLLHIPVAEKDPGQPSELALSNYPAIEQLAAQAVAAQTAPEMAMPEQAPSPVSELPALEDGSSSSFALARYDAPVTVEPQNFEALVETKAPQGKTPAAIVGDTARFVADPVIQKLPANYGVAPAAQSKPPIRAVDGTHLVQLGSFLSEQSAQRAWSIYARRNPVLKGHEMKISKAEVEGKRYWRVSAAGFDRIEAINMCSTVKKRGHDCIPYSAGKPLPGALD